MAGYTKLFSDIVHSTVWREDMHVKIVWITMLAIADRHGQVLASIPGLADLAKVSLEQCLDALAKLGGPDQYSRSREYDGRRIVAIDDGWLLLNYEKYRARKDDEEQRLRHVERTRRWREKLKSGDVTVTDGVTVTRGGPIAEAEADTENLKTLSGDAPDTPAPNGKTTTATAKDVLTFLNSKTGRRYQPVKVNIEMIAARLREGATPMQCRQVIVRKTREWLPDEKMAPYLRPATLFNRTKFWQYVGELVGEEQPT